MCVNCSGSGSAKMPVFQIRESCVQEHVLIIAPEPLAEALVAASTNKGALCQVAFDINDAAHHARNKTYDVIIVRARDNAGATALLLRLLRAAQPDSRLFLLLESNQATELGDCSLQADELLSISLSDERIIAAVGLGIMMSANNGMAVAA
jgi:DNA-binding NarL/FixJ family response regulator